MTGGSILSKDVKDFYADTSEEQNIGHLFGCISIDRFMDTALFKEHMDEMIREIKGCKKAPGVDEIFLPGEIEMRHRTENEKRGIPLTENTYKGLTDTAALYGIAPLQL